MNINDLSITLKVENRLTFMYLFIAPIHRDRPPCSLPAACTHKLMGRRRVQY